MQQVHTRWSGFERAGGPRRSLGGAETPFKCLAANILGTLRVFTFFYCIHNNLLEKRAAIKSNGAIGRPPVWQDQPNERKFQVELMKKSSFRFVGEEKRL
jgi:hypothetical protein